MGETNPAGRLTGGIAAMSELLVHKTLADMPRLLRVAEASRVLAISPRKLWSLTNCGDIPCVRIGRSVRYDPLDLSNWIESKKQHEGGHNPGYRGKCSRDGIS